MNALPDLSKACGSMDISGADQRQCLDFLLENPDFNIITIFADLIVEQYMHKIHNFSKKLKQKL